MSNHDFPNGLFLTPPPPAYTSEPEPDPTYANENAMSFEELYKNSVEAKEERQREANLAFVNARKAKVKEERQREVAMSFEELFKNPVEAKEEIQREVLIPEVVVPKEVNPPSPCAILLGFGGLVLLGFGGLVLLILGALKLTEDATAAIIMLVFGSLLTCFFCCINFEVLEDHPLKYLYKETY